MSNKHKPIYVYCAYHIAIVPKITARKFYACMSRSLCRCVEVAAGKTEGVKVGGVDTELDHMYINLFTNRDGYRKYSSDPKICAQCPTRHLCTRSKNCVKTVLRHIWKDYEELADDARYTPEYQELYAKRKETIERVFADAKGKHGMHYTLY